MMTSRNFDTTYKKASLSEGKKERLISDGGNLYMRLRAGKKGVKKSWQFNYHHPITNKRIKLTVGEYPAISLADARKKATSYHELLEKNVDPKSEGFLDCTEKTKREKKNTFEQQTTNRQWRRSIFPDGLV